MSFFSRIIGSIPADNTALIVGEDRISYGALSNQVLGAANWLAMSGVTRGKRVAISLSDPILQLYVSLGLMEIGAIRAALDPHLAPGSFQSLALEMGIEVIITDHPIPFVPNTFVLRAPDVDSLKLQSHAALPLLDLVESDIAVLSHGSGTTGAPKIMAFRYKHILARYLNYPTCCSVSSNERIMVLHRHTTLSYFARSIHTLGNGGCLVEVPKMRSGTPQYLDLLFDAVDRLSIDHLHCTVVHAKHIVDKAWSSSKAVRFLGLKSFLVGASPISIALRKKITQCVTPNLYINYGTNEAGPISWATPELLKTHPVSVGTVAPTTELVVLDSKGQPLESNKQGMIAVRGPCVIERYERDERATAKAFKDGWFHTGDVGYVTEDGAIHLLGRADDMMIIDGVNVYPVEIEQVIEQLPGVIEVAVTALYSDLGRDMIVAFVVREAPLTASVVAETCRRTLGWKTPRHVFFVKSLPRNSAGKVLRRELKKFIQQRSR